jgi:phenylpropionate dioxygenase-like ring-hydroxylating dioxygenase large terminal subunit|tara:strand:+ start:989 stop:1417 length:429 start_codon:yes stop_codon:yes gene_type:complete
LSHTKDASLSKLSDDPSHWVVVAKSAELDIPRPVVPVTLQGQRLVLFRDDDGKLGLIGRNCPHRGADLCFGRLEDNGLRCPFHGWHFDRTGQCVEQPAEPIGSEMYKQIKVPMISVAERDGLILAYVGADMQEAESNDQSRA